MVYVKAAVFHLRSITRSDNFHYSNSHDIFAVVVDRLFLQL